MSSKNSNQDKSFDVAIKSLSGLSRYALHELFETYRVWLRSGEASFVNSYASSRSFADLLHSMGLLTDGVDNAIGNIDNLFSGAELLASITGSLKPSLQARTEAKSEGGDNEEDLGGLSAAASAALETALGAGVLP